jgi:outer membrane protein
MATAFAAFFLCLCLAAPAAAFELGARGIYWFPSLTADVKVDDGGVAGDRINVKDTLGIKDESYPGFDVFLGHNRHRLTVAYTPISYSGATMLNQNIVFNGQTFTLNTQVKSSLDLRMLDVDYRYAFLDAENSVAGFSLGLILQIKYIDGEAKIHAPSLQTGSTYTFQVPLPMLGLGAHVGLLSDILALRAKATGIAYSGNYLFDAQADLSFTPFPFLDIHGGYKMVRLKIDYDDLLLDTQFSGPYVGLAVSF